MTRIGALLCLLIMLAFSQVASPGGEELAASPAASGCAGSGLFARGQAPAEGSDGIDR